MTGKASFEKHLFELKLYLKVPALVFIACFISVFYFSQYLISYIRDIVEVDLIAIHPYELFMVKVDLAFYISLVFTIPFVLFQLLRFFKPGLTEKEYWYLVRFIPLNMGLSLAGLALGFVFLVQMSTGWLKSLAVGTGVVNSWTIANVLSYMSKISFAGAVVFNVPLIVFLLVKVGVVTTDDLRKYRNNVIVGCIVFAAFISPPDLFSMAFLAVPTYGFFEFGVWLSDKG